MDLVRLPSILWRWRWVIASVVTVTAVALGLRLWTTRSVYEAQVRVQITAPQFEDVPLFSTGNRSSSYLRDDLTLARNNLLVVARSRVVHDRTIRQLELTGQDAAYHVDVRPLRDSDFVDLVVLARAPKLAEHIANVHAAHAIRYYGELRAKPAAATKDFLAEQLLAAAERLRAADATASALAVPTASTAPADIRQERETYELLLKKHAEAALAEENALRATYIQVVEPAVAPTRPASARKFFALAGLSLVGSVGLGMLLALLLESVVGRKGPAHSVLGWLGNGWTAHPLSPGALREELAAVRAQSGNGRTTRPMSPDRRSVDGQWAAAAQNGQTASQPDGR